MSTCDRVAGSPCFCLTGIFLLHDRKDDVQYLDSNSWIYTGKFNLNSLINISIKTILTFKHAQGKEKRKQKQPHKNPNEKPCALTKGFQLAFAVRQPT